MLNKQTKIHYQLRATQDFPAAKADCEDYGYELTSLTEYHYKLTTYSGAIELYPNTQKIYINTTQFDSADRHPLTEKLQTVVDILPKPWRLTDVVQLAISNKL